MDETIPNREVASFLLEPPPRPLFLHPSSSDESIQSSSVDGGATMTTTSGAIVTTATTQSRRHSSKWFDFLTASCEHNSNFYVETDSGCSFVGWFYFNDYII